MKNVRIGHLARNLRKERRIRGLSQYTLAELSGVARITIARIETGLSSQPNLATIRALASALGCRDVDLLSAPKPRRSAA